MKTTLFLTLIMASWPCGLFVHAQSEPAASDNLKTASSPPQAITKTSAEKGALPVPLLLELVTRTTYSFGPADSPDPFGVDYSGPLEKQGATKEDSSNFTLRTAVALLNVQAILADSHEAFINNYLFHEHDKFQLLYANGSCELTIDSIDSHGVEFRWDKDTTTAVYVPPEQDDIFSQETGDQTLLADQHPVIDVTATNKFGKGN